MKLKRMYELQEKYLWKVQLPPLFLSGGISKEESTGKIHSNLKVK